jgi:L-alanine-DL-glutamate epimerase-like enolase superfamily enzyme
MTTPDNSGPSLYERVAGLELQIESHRVELLEEPVSSGFLRVTTVITLEGTGVAGRGEDVTYQEELHRRRLETLAGLSLTGSHTLGSFSPLLEPFAPEESNVQDYLRWGFESAALDLALRQVGLSLPEAVGREYRPLRFVVSTRLGSPVSDRIVRGWLEHYPELELKLDPQSSWTEELAGYLAGTGRVRVVDFKGAYSGTPVDQPYDPELYRLVKRWFPQAYVEDPAPAEEALVLFADVKERLSWDAPIHSVQDITGLRWRPGAINIKPSRFGSLRRLLDAIEYCHSEGIVMYGGGQFELGPGRDHIQALASAFYADGPNDVAPRGFNVGDPRPGLPRSPLIPPSPARPGFAFAGEAAT